MRFLRRDEVHMIFPLFGGAVETGKITKSSFRNWVVSLIITKYPFINQKPAYGNFHLNIQI